MKDYGKAVRDATGSAGRTALQNILMRVPDKVSAAALAALTEGERARLYALIAPIKAARIREEIRLNTRRRTSSLTHARLMQSFLSYFTGGRTRDPRVWIRPVRRDSGD